MALAYALFILTVISFFYYLRLIKVLFFDQSTAEQGLDSNPALTVDRPRDERRLFLMIAIALRLVFYLFIVQSSLMSIRAGRLNALHLAWCLSP